MVLMTAFGSIETVVDALKSGALDYLSKPLNIEHLKLVVERALKEHREKHLIENLRTLTAHNQAYGKLVGVSPAMQKVYQLIEKIADKDSAVLIEGETGTGKELVAREIHLRSPRNGNRFIALSCVTLPETLLESELFGYEAGAFTDAKKRKQGLIEAADHGTLFLDEIIEIPLPVQAKLLRVLETGEFTRIGSTEALHSNFRLISATNKDVKELVAKGLFREDLFYRVNVIGIRVPPLRERMEDIIVLANHFLQQLSQGKIKDISMEAMLLLTRYRWPGNVRELEHIIERAVSLDTDGVITPADLPDEVRPKTQVERITTESVISPSETLDEARDKAEKAYLETLLKSTSGNISAASEIAGLSRAQFHLKLRKYKIDPDDYR
ncbi:MAG: sigma-54-dependent Fis family transcriptional regulator [Planctomycetes bacterium]|nr:sigma-54-dependent Fis family transcriptional regulator [Planctomycetota bacterium]